MPHAHSIPATGFQAVILCGPGSSFSTFTSNPDKNPKALLPIANRPMVWYPIEFCYRMGVTIPHSSASAISVALNTNPHLTCLPLPKPNILAPKDLEQNTGTAAIFRFPEVRELIKCDFIILPCDLVCELGGESLLEMWITRGIGNRNMATGSDDLMVRQTIGELEAGNGGLGVWYETKGDLIVNGEETDFIATAPLEIGPVPCSKTSLLNQTTKLVYTLPTDSLNDLTREKKGFPIRHGLIHAHTQLRMLSSHRDAHIYILPIWVMNFINKNTHMDSIGEDVIGWWAKAGWQVGLAEKLGFGEIFKRPEPNSTDEDISEDCLGNDYINFGNLSTTYTSETCISKNSESGSSLFIPTILAYVHPVSHKLIRRVDTAPLLRFVSLQLAKLESIDMIGKDASSPYAFQSKIAYPDGIAPRTTVTRTDCLIAENVTVEEKSSIKECVIGANCQIKSGAKLLRCVLMDGVVIGRGCKLTGCILGKRCDIGEDCTLQDCEVQENLLIEAGTEDKNNKLMSSEGMEATEEEIRTTFTKSFETGSNLEIKDHN